MEEPVPPPEPGDLGSAEPHEYGFSAETGESSGGIAGAYIVVLKNIDQPGNVARSQSLEHQGKLGFIYRYALKGYSISGLSRADAQALRRNPLVDYVVADQMGGIAEQKVPTGLTRSFATSNPDLDIDGQDDVRINADVAILDTGVDPQHPDLNVVGRANCVGAAPSCSEGQGVDVHGHGTHVAGTIGAIDNGEGVVGIAPGARLWGVKVLSDEGRGSTSDLVAGVDWITAHANQIEVANMSLEGYPKDALLAQAIEKSIDAGVVYVAAAGNHQRNSESEYPGAVPGVITVSALADSDGQSGGKGAPPCYGATDDTLADFSNWGEGVDIAAPGACIYSTLPEGKYGLKSGTSMASPHVAGAAALLASKANPEDAADVQAIADGLIEAGRLDWTDTSGDGEVEPDLYLGTPSATPEIATAGASSVGGQSVFAGTANARGLASEYHFEYGLTTGYGKTASASPGQTEDASHTNVTAMSQGLKPDQSYHYRSTATSSKGTIDGQDQIVTPSRWQMGTPYNQPANSGNEWLEDIACPTSQFCVAVGNYNSEKALLAYQWDGSNWTNKAVSLPAIATAGRLEDVYCSSSTSCIAVGRIRTEASYLPLSAQWNGASWTTEAFSKPAGAASPNLRSVSCGAPGDCVAVGYLMNEAGIWVTYSARLKNGIWTNLTTPNPTNAMEGELRDVSCSSASACVAVGWHDPQVGVRPTVVSWNGSSWSLQTPARTSGSLRSVDCRSSTFCVAVGPGPSAEGWNGSSWSNKTVPGLAGSTGGYLEDVSCTSVSYCMAVGAALKGPRYVAFGESFGSTGWKPQVMPVDGESRDELWGVACVALSGCKAVGGGRLASWAARLESRDDVETGEAFEVTPSSAHLTGELNPLGISTVYQFEIGTTKTYGEKVPLSSASAGAGSVSVDVDQQVGELQPETTYHYRLVVTNANGTAYGEDRAFRTSHSAYQFQSSIGTGGTGPGQLDGPWGLDTDAQGNLWVADRYNDRVQKFSPKGEYLGQFGGFGTADGLLNEPLDVAVTANGDIWVTDSGNNRVQKFDSTGKYLMKFGSSGTDDGQFTEPWGIDVAANGNVWVADARYHRIQQFNQLGGFISKVNEFQAPRGIAIDPDSHLWVTDNTAHRIEELSSSGTKLSQFGVKGTSDGQFEEPQAIDVKPSGDLLVVDRHNDNVQQFTPDGEYVGQFGAGQLNDPRGVVTSPGGVAYVSNTVNDRIEIWRQPIPLATTGGLSELSPTGATITGAVNPRGVATTYRFEYGKTTSYGTKVPVPNGSVGAGTADVAVSQAIKGLEPSTTYHYRLVAVNANGLVYGQDKVLVTDSFTGSRLDAMALTEPFNGTTSPISNFAVNWSALGWAGGTIPKGSAGASGWGPQASYPTVNGAYYAPTLTDTGSGIGATATMAVSPGAVSRYFSLWLDSSGSSATRNGYELRLTYVSSNTYDVTLSKWQAGAQTVLASKTSYFFANGNSLAIADEGSTVSALSSTGSGFKGLLSASDSSFAGGNAGVEGAGSTTKLTNFKVGHLLSAVPNMDAAIKALPLRDTFSTNEKPLLGGGIWAALSWDNSTTGHNTGEVDSNGWGPYNSYPTINGAHWQKSTFADTGGGVAVATKLSINPASSAGRYFSLWVAMPSPASARSGYELRFTESSSNVYEVVLGRWQGGVKTSLASKAGYSLPKGSQLAVLAKGGTVSAWTKTGSEYTQLLSAADTTFTAGYAGMEGSGSNTRLKDFAAGPLAPF